MNEKASKYSVVAKYYPPDGGFIAVCEEFPGTAVYGDTREEAVKELAIVLDILVEEFDEEGRELPAPLLMPDPLEEERNGEMSVSLPSDLYTQLLRYTQVEGVPINALVVALLTEAIDRLTGTPPISASVESEGKPRPASAPGV